jgi:GNAT superfamily N-acetyltransferase
MKLDVPQIRPLTGAHAATVSAVAREIWYQHYPGIITVRQMEYMLGQRYRPAVIRAQIASGQAWWFGAWIDDVLSGFAACEPGSRSSTMKLDKLYVRLRYRGRGHGRALMEQVQRFACAQGCTEIYLQVNKYNAQSIEFYERNRFIVSDAIRVDIGSGFVMDDYLMTRKLERPLPEEGMRQAVAS